MNDRADEAADEHEARRRQSENVRGIWRKEYRDDQDATTMQVAVAYEDGSVSLLHHGSNDLWGVFF